MKRNFQNRIISSRPLLYLVVMCALIISTLPLLFVVENKVFLIIEILISIILTPLFAEWIWSNHQKNKFPGKGWKIK